MAARPEAVRRKALALIVGQAEPLITVSTFLSGLAFTALFAVQTPDSFQTVRVFFLVSAASGLFAAVLSGCVMLVAREVQFSFLWEPDAHVIEILAREQKLLACLRCVRFGVSVFVFVLVMALGGLLRYSMQAYFTAGEVIGIVATSISILGAFVAVFVTLLLFWCSDNCLGRCLRPFCRPHY